VERELTGILILQKKTCAGAYADDVSIYLEDQEDINNEEATGPEINFSKSKALPLEHGTPT
jgi:hypothetical protein